MKTRKQLRHDLAGFTRADTEALALTLFHALDAVPEGAGDCKRIRRVLLDLIEQCGPIMQGQQAAEHRGLLPPLHGWEQFDGKISEQFKM